MLEALGSSLKAALDALALGFAATTFHAEAFARVAAEPGGRDLAWLVAYLAGVSQAVGQGTVLWLNRVRPARFLLSLALMGAIFLASAFLIAASTLLVADLLGRRLALAPTLAVIALAHAPRLLGALSLAPYVGEHFDRLLDIWVLLLVAYGLREGLGLPAQSAMLLAMLGWIAARLLWLLLGRPLTAIGRAARSVAAGEPLTVTAQNLADTLLQLAQDSPWRRDRRK